MRKVLRCFEDVLSGEGHQQTPTCKDLVQQQGFLSARLGRSQMTVCPFGACMRKVSADCVVSISAWERLELPHLCTPEQVAHLVHKQAAALWVAWLHSARLHGILLVTSQSQLQAVAFSCLLLRELQAAAKETSILVILDALAPPNPYLALASSHVNPAGGLSLEAYLWLPGIEDSQLLLMLSATGTLGLPNA